VLVGECKKMNVKLIGFMPDSEKIPAMAAKLTHSKTKPENLDKSSDKELSEILKHVMNLGHTSVIEHTCFTFAISDVSRSLTHQLVRHRIASYAQQSQRYVDLCDPSFVIPPKISKNKDMKQAYENTMNDIWNQYNKLLGDEFDFQIDGIELDSKLISIVKDRFNLNYDNLNIYNADGRMFLSQNDNKYDIIILDAFSKQLYIPHNLSTKEFFNELSPHLTEDGVVGINVVAISPESPLLKTFTNTLASEFEYVYVAPVKYSYNYFILASNKKVNFSEIAAKIDNNQLNDLAISIKNNKKQVSFNPDELVLTDDKAPIEYLTDKMAFEYFYH